MSAGLGEEWRDIPGFEGCYQASSMGRIRSLDRIGGGKERGPYKLRGRLLSIRKRETMHDVTVTLTKGGESFIKSAQAWVWMAFNGPVPELMCVAHVSDDVNDNRPKNLMLKTYSEIGLIGARKCHVVRYQTSNALAHRSAEGASCGAEGCASMKLTDYQLQTLRHMLGIDDPCTRAPKPYRDNYCANPRNEHLHELARIGAVRLYAQRDGYEWYCTTEAGRAAAMESHKRIQWPKPKRVYSKWLDVRDALPDVTFQRFLTAPQFAETRRDA